MRLSGELEAAGALLPPSPAPLVDASRLGGACRGNLRRLDGGRRAAAAAAARS